MIEKVVPLFPLGTVLFPQGPLPLRVFEPRYLDMISRCLKDESQFGVLLIYDGSEVGSADTYSVGTKARICDWYQGSDGILGLTAIGTQKFRLVDVKQQSDGLYLGEIDVLDPEPSIPLPEDYLRMADLLRAIVHDLGRLYQPLEKHFDDSTWVGNRFGEVLPVPMQYKQHCLEIDHPLERLRFIQPLLRSMRQETLTQ
ncbi:MAG: LON peptidase substrate-binding domain-containing protein [Pseudomonadota bacterium]|nr:LON peptidase substrate-binding domain-containing protein [Pseudomonadota bacterium]